MTFVKSSANVPSGFFAAEAAGLRWLAAADGARVVRVQSVAEDRLVLERLTPASPSAPAAREFGAALARTHAAGAESFGYTPDGHRAWFGPLSAPFEVPTTESAQFSQFWAGRLDHVARLAAPVFRESNMPTAPIAEAIAAVRAGKYNGIAGRGTQTPSRVHGDLWSGNLMWTPGGAVLIDPAAHGGHRLEDLALLALFGAPFLDEIYAGYVSAQPLPDGWQRDLVAHSFFALLAHVYLFGGGYAAQAVNAAYEIAARR